MDLNELMNQIETKGFATKAFVHWNYRRGDQTITYESSFDLDHGCDQHIVKYENSVIAVDDDNAARRLIMSYLGCDPHEGDDITRFCNMVGKLGFTDEFVFGSEYFGTWEDAELTIVETHRPTKYLPEIEVVATYATRNSSSIVAQETFTDELEALERVIATMEAYQ